MSAPLLRSTRERNSRVRGSCGSCQHRAWIATFHDRSGIDETALTWDLAKQRQVMLDDVFVKDSRWNAATIAYCKTELHKQFAERQAPDRSDEEIAATVSSSAAWSWGTDKATVVFMIELIGGLARRRVRRGNSLLDVIAVYPRRRSSPVRSVLSQAAQSGKPSMS
jgi:hypothetical protein